MARKWQREHHHHHQRLTSLLVQYSHLNIGDRLEALYRDVTELAETIPDKGRAARVLDKIADRLHHY